jgi:glutamine amidotransferase
MLSVIDSGVGNAAAILAMLEHLGIPAAPARTGVDLAEAAGIILPGVGAFDQGMQALDAGGLRGELDRLVLGLRRPVLGICLGMQLMGRDSAEGRLPGLGWVPARTESMDASAATQARLRLPHLGWADVRGVPGCPLFPEAGTPRFWFAHGYRMVCDQAEDCIATASYGADFCAAVRHGNCWGVQFHPERSHRFGLDLLVRFACIARTAA